MKFNELKKTLLRLFNSYVKRYFDKLILSLILSLVVAGSTGAIAWLLDPAIKKIFVDQDKTMMLVIPIAIALTFTIKGASLYAARIILINISNNVVKNILEPEYHGDPFRGDKGVFTWRNYGTDIIEVLITEFDYLSLLFE